MIFTGTKPVFKTSDGRLVHDDHPDALEQVAYPKASMTDANVKRFPQLANGDDAVDIVSPPPVEPWAPPAPPVPLTTAQERAEEAEKRKDAEPPPKPHKAK